MGWKVYKFGGSSLATGAHYLAAARIVGAGGGSVCTVVSAAAGVTDRLFHLLELARKSDAEWESGLQKLFEHQNGLAKESEVTLSLDQDRSDLRDLLRAVALSKFVSRETRDLVTGYGEIWSAGLLSGVLGSTVCDAREIIVAEDGQTGPLIQWEECEKRFKKWSASIKTGFVATGFIASRGDGVPTTLGRNGSDFSASIFAALLGAEELTIWTDVDGVLSADPGRVPNAHVLKQLTYNEAMELAYFGAKVLHPHTMAPVLNRKIPLRIRNSQNPEAEGTLIGGSATSKADVVKGFALVDSVGLINVEGSGMVGVPGVAHRLFGALREKSINVILISQASSEHSICFAVPQDQLELASKTVSDAFVQEKESGRVQRIERIENCAVLAAVGEGMVETPGVSARFFRALGKARVNVRAIAQGSSERNISAVIGMKDGTKALRAVHSGFYLSEQTLSVGLVGPGLIGATFLKQVYEQQEALKTDLGIDIRIRGICNSRKMLLSEDGLDRSWEKDLAKGEDLDWGVFIEHLKSDTYPHTVIVDCTASEQVSSLYSEWLEKGMHLVTPNKKANSGDVKRYARLQKLSRRYDTLYFYEATVGAGLPILSTLRELQKTGDRLLRIEGVLSGTLSYLFNTYDGSTPFSEVVRVAREKGFTEPDPRDDLSGMDVARKLIILARESGSELDLSSIQVESLVPEPLRKVTIADEFLEGLKAFDGEMEKRFRAAQKNGQVLRFVGLFDGDKASVKLQALDKSHPFAALTGSDNIVLFQTERYSEQPLVIRGPGAGPDVTAGGVFGDLLRVASHLGAPK